MITRQPPPLRATPSQRSVSRTLGAAKRIRLTVSAARYIDRNAVMIDRVVAVCVLLPFYVFSVTDAYRGVGCVWDVDHSQMAWLVFPLSLFPMYVVPAGFLLRLPFLWEAITKDCPNKHCAPIHHCSDARITLTALALVAAAIFAYALAYFVFSVKRRRSPIMRWHDYEARAHRVASALMRHARSRARKRARQEDARTRARIEELYDVGRVPMPIAELIADMSRTDFEGLVPPSGLDSVAGASDANTDSDADTEGATQPDALHSQHDRGSGTAVVTLGRGSGNAVATQELRSGAPLVTQDGGSGAPLVTQDHESGSAVIVGDSAMHGGESASSSRGSIAAASMV